MDLVLWRHAEAEPGEPDLGRRLTPKGLQQAERMARWLDHHLPDSARVLVSPAARAQQTALALRRRFKTVDGLAPASAADILTARTGPTRATRCWSALPTLGTVAAHCCRDSAPTGPSEGRRLVAQ
jgi:phosphohistidine phosphatase